MKKFFFILVPILCVHTQSCKKTNLDDPTSSPLSNSIDRGTPIVGLDIVVQFNGAEQSPCPNTTQQVQTNTNNGLSTFVWDGNEQFEISISYNNTSEKIRLHVEAGQGGNQGIAKCYKSDSFSCLTNPGTSESSDKKELSITAFSNVLLLHCYESPDGSEDNYISIAHPTGYTIVVRK